MLFLDVCGSLHLSLGTVICGITNKWALPLEGRICAFLRGEKEFGRVLSSQWIKVLFPLQLLITTTENEREKEGKCEGGGGRDKGKQRSWRKTAYATHGWLSVHTCFTF